MRSILACPKVQPNAAIWFMSVSLLLLSLRFLVISRRLLISMGLWYCIIARIVCTQLVLFVYRLLWYLDNHSNHRVIVLHRERDKRINKHSDWHGKHRLLLPVLEYNTSHKPHVFQTDSRHTTGYDADTRVRNGSVHTPLRVVVLSQVGLDSGRLHRTKWPLSVGHKFKAFGSRLTERCGCAKCTNSQGILILIQGGGGVWGGQGD